MIKLACSTVSLPRGPLDEVLDTIAELGFKRVELVAHGGPGPDLQQTTPEQLARAFEKAGLELIGIYPKPFDTRDQDLLDASLPYVQRTIDVVAELGCERVVFTPLHPSQREEPQYVLMAEGCRRLAEYIGDRPVTVCLENHHTWPLSYAADYERIMGDVDDPCIAITVDTGHFTASEVDQVAFVQRFADRIRHLHLKDQVGTKTVPFGEGQTPNAAVLRELESRGYDGYASLELELRDVDDPVAALRAARAAALEIETLVD